LAGAQVVAQLAFMDGINARHPNLHRYYMIGDIVDTATNDNTGAVPLAGPRWFIEQFNARMKRGVADLYCLAGNHDRDGSGLGAHQFSWSMNGYRQFFGRNHYFVRSGNMVDIFIGDFGGSVGGEIPYFVRTWLDAVLRFHAGCNVMLYIHQPLEGTYKGLSTPDYHFQRESAGIQAIINKYDNIAMVGYGHVGATFADCIDARIVSGVYHVNFQTGIPTAFNFLTGAGVARIRDLPYSIMKLTKGASSAIIERWNGTTGVRHNGGANDVSVPLKYPASFSKNGPDFDGRFMSDNRFFAEMVNTPVTFYRTLADLRSAVAPFDPTVGIYWGVNSILSDDSNNDAVIGMGVGYSVDLPGSNSVADSGGFTNTVLPGHGFGGGISWERATDTEEDYGSEADIWCRDYASGSGLPEKVLSARPSASAVKGVYLPNDGGFYSGVWGVRSYTADTLANIALRTGNVSQMSSSTTVLQMQKIGAAGNVLSFYNGTTFSGGISVNGGATAFNATSDAVLKTNIRDTDKNGMLKRLRRVKLRDFDWKKQGTSDYGVIAQELLAAVQVLADRVDALEKINRKKAKKT
jgi:hypothetical protein